MELGKIVKEILIEQGETNLNKFARYLQFGISGLREFHLDTTGVPKIIALTVNANGTADLPNDYVSYLKIAVCGFDGNLHSLAYNPNMCMSVDFDDCGNINPNPGGFDGGLIGEFWDIGNHYRNGQNTGGYFGSTPINRFGNYRIDEKNRLIILQNFTGENLVLEYLADLDMNENGTFEVHPYLVEAIKAYIQWKSSQRNVRAQLGLRQLNYEDYKMEKSKAERRFAAFTISEVHQMINRHNQLSPKF